MKNLQKLLIAAVFASVIPSTVVLCSIIHTDFINKKPPMGKAILASAIVGQLGFYGAIIGAARSNALKTTKKALKKANNLTAETLVQLNKGIKRNRIIMATSLATVALPFAVIKLDRMSNARKQTRADEDLLKKFKEFNKLNTDMASDI